MPILHALNTLQHPLRPPSPGFPSLICVHLLTNPSSHVQPTRRHLLSMWVRQLPALTSTAGARTRNHQAWSPQQPLMQQWPHPRKWTPFHHQTVDPSHSPKFECTACLSPQSGLHQIQKWVKEIPNLKDLERPTTQQKHGQTMNQKKIQMNLKLVRRSTILIKEIQIKTEIPIFIHQIGKDKKNSDNLLVTHQRMRHPHQNSGEVLWQHNTTVLVRMSHSLMVSV